MKRLRKLYIYISLSSLILHNLVLPSDLDTEVQEAKRDAYRKKADYYKINKTANAVNSYVGAATSLAMLLLMWRAISGGSNKNFTLVNAKDISVNFASIIGNDEAKKEFQQIIEFIKSPEVFTEKGVKPSRGIILWGPPGNGKTMLAKALAKECGCNFIETSATQLTIQSFVGTGAARVRELFALARKNTPCIVFIDEFDAVAHNRANATKSFENESVNELLTQLDGFNNSAKKSIWGSIKSWFGFKSDPSKDRVVVIVATNFPTTLDKAVTRPGRFDRAIEVKNPNLKSRIELLKHALNELHFKKTLTEEQYNECGKDTEGFSNADIAIGVGEAVGRYAVNKNLKDITMGMVQKMIKQMKERSGQKPFSEDAQSMYI